MHSQQFRNVFIGLEAMFRPPAFQNPVMDQIRPFTAGVASKLLPCSIHRPKRLYSDPSALPTRFIRALGEGMPCTQRTPETFSLSIRIKIHDSQRSGQAWLHLSMSHCGTLKRCLGNKPICHALPRQLEKEMTGCAPGSAQATWAADPFLVDGRF